MSELRANTISDAAGTGPATLTGQSAAKAHFYTAAGASAPATALNISSVTDSGTGNYEAAFTNNFTTATYSGVVGYIGATEDRLASADAYATSQIGLRVFDISAASRQDGGVSSCIMGDLA